jgi:hypothetical protein
MYSVQDQSNIAAILEAVDLQTIPNFLKIASSMLIVTLRMTKQAHSRAPVRLTTRLSSAPLKQAHSLVTFPLSSFVVRSGCLKLKKIYIYLVEIEKYLESLVYEVC